MRLETRTSGELVRRRADKQQLSLRLGGQAKMFEYDCREYIVSVRIEERSSSHAHPGMATGVSIVCVP